MPRALAAIVVGLAVGAFATWTLTRPEPFRPAPPMAFEAGLPAQHRVDALAVSPDASRFAYVGEIDGVTALYVRALDQLEPQRLEGTEGARAPFFSPDGEWLAFFARDRLWRIPAAGGRVAEVCDAPTDSAGGSWGPDGRIVFAPLDGRGLVRVDATGGEPRVLTTINREDGEIAHGWPHVLPDGVGIVLTIARRGRDARLAVLGPEGGEGGERSAADARPVPKLLLPATGHAQYVSSGHLIYGFAGRLQALAFDLETLDSRGAPMTIAPELKGSPRGFGGLGVSRYAASPGDLVVFVPGTQEDPPSQLVWVTRDGASAPVSDVSARHQTPRLAPRGDRVAVVVWSGMFGRDIWIQEPTGGRVRLTGEGSENHSPVWSPDGRELAFASNRAGPQNVYVRPALPRGTARRLIVTGGTHSPASWRRNTLVFYEVTAEAGRDIWQHEGRGDATPVVATAANERAPALSPDGRWLAYTSDAADADDIYVRSLAGGDTVRVSDAGGTEPVWAPAGDELFYRQGDRMIAVPIVTDPALGVGHATVLFERAYERDPGANVANYDVAPDGRFLMLRRVDPPVDAWILFNWPRP